MAALLALYLVLYLCLIVAYVSVLKYMAEKPEEILQFDTVEQAAIPGAETTPPMLPEGSAA